MLTQGGFLLKCAHDFGYLMDVGPGDRLFWLTDLGWLMGPMLITAGLFHGGTAVLFEGVPDYPKPNRLWALVERHKITVMGLSPTAVRALMPHGAEHVHAHELGSLRVLGSTGEPWNPEPYRWLFENVGQGPLADHQLHGRHRDLRRHPQLLSRSRRSSRARSPGPSRAWPPTASARTAGPCAGKSASWS